MTTDNTGIPDEVAIRIMDYLDHEMSDDERSTFEADLASDPGLQRDLEALQSTMGVVQSLQMKFAPDHFVSEVESKVRTRSRGRFFAYQALYTSRIPYEVFAVVAIAIMAGMWMMSSPDDARFSADLALSADTADAGEGHKATPDAGAEAVGAGVEAAGAGLPKEAAVRPLKTEVIEYTFTLPAGSSVEDLDKLAARLRATSRRYVVERNEGELEVTIPAASLDGFLRDFGKGSTLKRETVTADSAEDTAKVRFRSP
jgi:hypothetical protein